MKKFMLEMLPFVALFMMLVFASCKAKTKVDKMPRLEVADDLGGLEVAYFADACYWCTEGIWEALEGVVDVQSGFVGGTYPKHPTYANHGDYAEGNRITYDPKVITYKQLVYAYFNGHSYGKSPDRGESYRAIAFYEGAEQHKILNIARQQADHNNGYFQQDIGPVSKANWTPGPESHQDYIQRLEAGEPVPNKSYGVGESIPRRDKALKLITAPKKLKLNEEAHYIMVDKGTERPFSSVLNSEKRRGVYLSPATGDTLFLSTAKFNSGTGWPSFDAATDKVALGDSEQGGREVIEKSTGLHLGHLFIGEHMTTNNKRFCINGGALQFIPTEK